MQTKPLSNTSERKGMIYYGVVSLMMATASDSLMHKSNSTVHNCINVSSSNSSRIYRIYNPMRYSLEKLLSNKKILSNFKNLSSNWNEYNSEPIKLKIIEKTEKLISHLEFQPQIFPTGRGTIQIEYFKNDKNFIEIEISEEEQFLYKVQDGEDIEEEIGIEDVPSIIEKFYA